MGLYFGKGELKKEVTTAVAGDVSFRIPAGAKNHEMRALHVIDQDVNIVSYFPHMQFARQRHDDHGEPAPFEFRMDAQFGPNARFSFDVRGTATGKTITGEVTPVGVANAPFSRAFEGTLVPNKLRR